MTFSFKQTAGMMLAMFLLANSSYLYADGCSCVTDWNANNQAWLKSNSISFEMGPNIASKRKYSYSRADGLSNDMISKIDKGIALCRGSIRSELKNGVDGYCIQ